eukprot:185161-Lingulodinium_polyedra.AAC.1
MPDASKLGLMGSLPKALWPSRKDFLATGTTGFAKSKVHLLSMMPELKAAAKGSLRPAILLCASELGV